MAKKSMKDIMKIIEDYHKQAGFTIINLEQDEYSKNYFTYRVKELNNHWIFGVHIFNKKDKVVKENDFCLCDNCKKNKYPQEDDYIQVQLFTQYDKDIDKFKFSRSYYRAQFTFYDIKQYDVDRNDKYNYLYQINDILTEIKNHPYVARCYSGCYFEPPYTTPLKAWFICQKWNYEEWCKKHHNKIKYRKIVNTIKYYKLMGHIDKYTIKDRNFDGFCCYPRWSVVVIAKKDKYADKIDNKLEKISHHNCLPLEDGFDIVTYSKEQ